PPEPPPRRPSPSLEILGASDAREEIRRAALDLRVEDPGEREDDVIGCELAAVVKLHALAQRERPHEPVSRRLPEAGERGGDRERLIELDEAVEGLLGHGGAGGV